MTRSSIIVALDFPAPQQALDFVARLDSSQCRLKIGKELFTRGGPAMIEAVQAEGFDVFLDLKYHDIPNTVAGAVRAAADLGVWMVNVHASGGSRMMRAAHDALGSYSNPPLLIAVTVLTSLSGEELAEIGWSASPQEQVVALARLAAASELDGVVCSAQEASMLRNACGEDFCLVTPGIRRAVDSAGDQRRVVTPLDAVEAGADYLVIGRPITTAQDPGEVLHEINAELNAAGSRRHCKR